MTRQKIYRYVILICGLILISYFIYAERNLYQQHPLDNQLTFENPSYVTADANHIYVVDRSMKRIIKMNSDGRVEFFIEGGKRKKGSFYYCSELAVDSQGNIYALNRVLDYSGAYVEKEEIIRYTDKGKFDEIVYSKTYKGNNRPVREVRMTALTYHQGALYFLYKNKSEMELNQVYPDVGLVYTEKAFTMANLDLMLVDAKISPDISSFGYSTKDGNIYYHPRGGEAMLIYSAEGENSLAEMSIPWRISLADNSNAIYFSDIGQRKIIKFNSSEATEVIGPELWQQSGLTGEPGAFYYFDVTEDGVLYSVNKNNLIKVAGGTINYCSDTATYSSGYIVYRFFAWMMALLWLAGFILLCRYIYIDGMKRKLPVTTVQIAFIFVTVLLSAGIVFHMLYQSLITRYEEKVFNNLAQTAQLASVVIEGDALKRINQLDHYQNEDYQLVRNQLFKVFNHNEDQWNQGQYGALYQVFKNEVYATMFYDDSIGTCYPIDFDFANSKYADTYNQGKIITVKESDADGDWMYALGPVYNSQGQIVGVVEVGTDLYGFSQENQRLIKNIILDVGTVLIILAFVLIEVSLLRTTLAHQQILPSLTRGPVVDTKLARPVGFLLMMAISFPTAFMPVLMKQLYRPIFGLPEGVVIGLPISVEMLMIAVFSVIAGHMLDDQGWKPVFRRGLLLLVLGTILSGLTKDPLVFIATRAIVGAGAGLAMMALDSFIQLAPTEDDQRHSVSNLTSGIFAGINCGIVIGSMLAERIGYSNVFLVSACFLAIAALFAGKMMPGMQLDTGDNQTGQLKIKVRQFFADKSVLAFFLLIFIPISICGMFLGYFFPLFVESGQISPANIGRAFLLNGLCIIYLGPLLSKYAAKYLGAKKSVLVYTLLVAGAMLLFASQGTILAAYLTVIMLGIADSFGAGLMVNYYSGLPVTNQLGEGKAMGYFTLVENIGQMLGPMVLGSLMIFGEQKGVGLLGVGLCIMLILFVLVSGNFRRERVKTLQS